MTGTNSTSQASTDISALSIGGLDTNEIIGYSIGNFVLLAVIIGLICVYRMNYLHVVDDIRIE